MDEGTAGLGLVRMAGSGILRNLQDLMHILKHTGVTAITSHDGCGAANIAAGNQNFKGTPDEYGRQFAQQLAGELGIRYEHIAADQMKRPPNFHIARTAYICNLPWCDFKQLSTIFPPGFVIDATRSDIPEIMKELRIAAEIATGPHGFGLKLLENSQMGFVIVIIGDNDTNITRSIKQADFPVKTTIESIQV